MENRKFVIPFLILALISTVLPSSVFAYEINTHAYLTDEVINFYNRNYENNISDELKDYLIDGSRKEDDNPRWMNHFYDPVKERGLSQDSSIDPMYRLGNWQMSKEWANDDKNQNKLTYKVPTTIASILTTFQEKKISELTTETDFTWDKAIRYWTRGEKEKAMFILGHILHLIEDVSVPDHTRNDPHANGSPYEEWASQFTLENTDLNLYNETLVNNPVYLNNLEDYFNELAKYSNNNFYSKDTIGIQSGYNFPEPIDFELINGYYYGISKDKYGSRYYLVYQKSRKGNFISTNNLDLDIDDELVIKDYWNRLSIKAVQYGAGVVDLFFKEVERAENDPDFVKEEPKSFFAQAIDVMNGLVGNILSIFSSDEDLDLDEEIILDDENNLNTENNLNLIYDLEDSVEEEFNYFIEDEDLVSEITENDLEKQEENNEDDSSQLEDFVINKPTEPEQKICSFETDKPVIYGSVLISEVAWAGTLNSANDEWIELKNTGGDINISGWQLIDKKEQIKVLFKDTTLAGGEFYLLERTDDESVPAVIADYIYTGALSNNDEGLRLFDDECNLIDEVLASPDWPAGDSGAKRTMERLSDLTWHSYSGSGENNIFGTPKKDNSPVVIYHSSGGGGSSSSNNAEENTSSNEPVYMPDILISEIQTSGGSSKDEFIELYNPNNESVDLTNWYIKRKSSSGNEYSLVSSSRLEAKLIPAKGYFLLANEEGYDGDVFVDVSWAKSNSISSDNTVILYKPDDSVSDKVGFGNAADYEVEVFPNNPGDNESLHRNSDIDTNNNKEDFLIDDSTPQNSNTFGEFLTPNGLTEGVDAVSVNHLVISEVYINMDGSDDEEFIELYNPTNGIINLENYSLQYLSGSASSTEQITKKNFNNGNISSKGFYLIGLNGYSGEVDADMTWSQSLNNTSATIALVATTSVISDESDSNIVDKVAYGVSNGYLFPETTAALLPSEGSSLERKAFKNSSCSDSVDSGEFLGNGCDTDNNSDNFIERENPNPQNSNSLIEPRNSPIDINNFSAEYNTSTLSINLNWDESYNYAGNSENITYVLTYATSTENDLSEVTATTTYNFNIDEAGIDYEFGIIAKDINGLASEKSSATLSVPTLINNLYLYKDTRSTSSKEYLLEFDYNSYPFIPDTFDKGDAWKIAIFYLNIEAPNEIELNTFNNWSPENIDNVLAIEYDNCGGSNSSNYSLVLPDILDNCNNGGGVANASSKWDLLEDNHLLFELATTTDDVTLTSEDFVTIGFYSLAQSGGGSQRFKLVGLDRNKYYYQESTPTHQPPNAPNNFELSLNESNSKLRIIWDKVDDTDTLDGLITYEINYTTGDLLDENNWTDEFDTNLNTGEAAEISGRAFAKIFVESNSTYLIGVRAKDEFNNYSNTSTIAYEVSEISPPYGLSGVTWKVDPEAPTGSSVLSFTADAYPFISSTTPSAMIFFLNQDSPSSYEFNNTTDRWNVGGDNRFLKLRYNNCYYGNDENLGGLFMYHEDNCPSGTGISKRAITTDLSIGQSSFDIDVLGAFNIDNDHEFSASDYITIGFYTLQGNRFKEVAAYNTKTYYQE